MLCAPGVNSLLILVVNRPMPSAPGRHTGVNATSTFRVLTCAYLDLNNQFPVHVSISSKGPDTHSHSEGDDECDDVSTIGPSTSQRAPRKTVAERKATLEADSRVANIKPDEVQCRKCEKWIRLSTKMEYALGNWNKHALICCDAVYVSDIAMWY